MSSIGSLDRVGVSGRWGWGALTLVVLGVGTLSALVLSSTAAGAGVGDVPVRWLWGLFPRLGRLV